ncbi:Smr/MutS family protein [Chitinophaga niabensis]|uniref:Smr domain-containing protein n=1 Tax=Chitinophaga niabensis TaxID=536979 RepID=A0A1N6EGS7_9BACT|nr:Smr/MutS family protein [Chitinophaga niabensis]SIN82213.1 Smr domain-containing protein [Chitinophaga niabensis]
MKYTVGDKILLLHSKEEGTVVDIMGDDMVLVEVGKSTFPVYLDQIDFPYFHRFTKGKTPLPPKRTPGEEIPREKPSAAPRVEKGVFLTMLPIYESDGIDDVVTTLKFHLLNQTGKGYNYRFEIWLNNKLFLELKQDIHAFQHTYLADLEFEQLNDNPRFEFTFSPKETDLKLAASFEKTWKVKAKQLFQQLGQQQEKQQATIDYLLFDKYPLRTETDAYGFSPVEKKKLQTLTTNYSIKDTTPVTAKYEVDLHIEKLASNWQELSNLEMLGIQLNEFQYNLDLAIAQHQKSMIVIHGIGSGKLRDEVHEILKTVSEVKYFVNQYHPFYGYGATEIFFK